MRVSVTFQALAILSSCIQRNDRLEHRLSPRGSSQYYFHNNRSGKILPLKPEVGRMAFMCLAVMLPQNCIEPKSRLG